MSQTIIVPTAKPLGRKSYGSIGHLPNSRLGTGDHHVHEGQAKICTVEARSKWDLIIVQEKLDGSNVGVAKVDGEILALNRAGYLAETSPFVQHHYFAKWVDQNKKRFDALLKERERACGEWLMQAHGSRYRLWHEPFVLFDIFTPENQRLCFSHLNRRVYESDSGFFQPFVVSVGPPISIEEALKNIPRNGNHGCEDELEGFIYRVENCQDDTVDFLAKYVRPDKEDGKYLESVCGKVHWNTSLFGGYPFSELERLRQ